MEILSFENLPSTQRWLTEAIRSGKIAEPIAVLTREQTDGVGSRDNRWIGYPGNFFASIALRESDLPEDLPPSAASIYFGWVMRELLRELGQPVWLKWPNDLYLGSKKAGGVITTRLRSFYVAGIGVNLQKSEKNFAALETELSPMILLDMYLQRLESAPKWKELFRKYRLEFERSRPFGTHRGAEFISLEKAQLMEDGSIMLDGERIVELR